MKYVPGKVIDSLCNLKKKEGLSKDSAAFERMAFYADKGRSIPPISEIDPVGRAFRPARRKRHGS